MTSLLDEARDPAANFGVLYHRRWRAEEAFKRSLRVSACMDASSAHSIVIARTRCGMQSGRSYLRPPRIKRHAYAVYKLCR